MCCVSRLSGIKEERVRSMGRRGVGDVGARLAAYVLVLVFWAMTAASLDGVFRSLGG